MRPGRGRASPVQLIESSEQAQHGQRVEAPAAEVLCACWLQVSRLDCLVGHAPVAMHPIVQHLLHQAVSVLFATDPHVQGLMCSLVLASAIIAQALHAPFAGRVLNYLELLSLVCSYLTFNLGQFTFVEGISGDMIACVSIVVFLANAAFFGGALWAVLEIIKQQKKKDDNEEGASTGQWDRLCASRGRGQELKHAHAQTSHLTQHHTLRSSRVVECIPDRQTGPAAEGGQGSAGTASQANSKGRGRGQHSGCNSHPRRRRG